MRPRFTLAGQFLALQLMIVVAVLLAVVGVSVAQADARFRQVEGQSMLAVAESAASMGAVRTGLTNPDRQGILQPTAERLRGLSNADHLVIAGTDRRMRSSADPRRIGQTIDLSESTVLSGRTWIGVMAIGEERVLAAHVPVIDGDGEIVGVAAAGRTYPGPVGQVATAAPTLLVYLGIASVLGVAGSLLLARRIKRQTLGLEPEDITRLAEDRTAMLHGIKEGVLGLDRDNRVTLVNDKAAELLRLPPDAAGRTLSELGVEPDIYSVLTDRVQEPDRVVLMGDRLVTLNWMPLNSGDRSIGSVTTMRDRTDLAKLQQELDLTLTTTEALRAQAHEFSNQLHVITGLLELEEYDEVARYVNTIGGARTQLADDVTSRVADSSVAALLIAKASLAAEQDVALRVSELTRLGAQDEQLSADLVTVVGNLVDNALDAVRGDEAAWVEVELVEHDDAVRLRVRDSGRGVPPELVQEVFRRGFSTKGAGGAYRGVGLALVRLVCSRRGGAVGVEGAEFTAWLPHRRYRTEAS
ncbi:sensor histidine kinase [Allosalinactinospora lopnorensis]|uniref:sensor histidine kinase n=1 Tax=Allosalinactinospora lopnorensis TaxID=1352348 RepID=UPI000623D25A|nr:sensor histidine kinase [Allosalinactinospora lopnorensis]